MKKKDAEALGWVFDIEQPETQTRVSPTEIRVVPARYSAWKRKDQIRIVKEFTTMEALLADIDAWERDQPAPFVPEEAPPEPIPLPNKDLLPDEHARAAALVAEGVDWRDQADKVFLDPEQLHGPSEPQPADPPPVPEPAAVPEPSPTQAEE